MTDSIVGKWKIEGGDYPLVREFLLDGTFIQRVGKLPGQSAPYSIEGNEVVFAVEQPNGTTLEQRERFELAGETLTFYAEDIDETTVYRRQRD